MQCKPDCRHALLSPNCCRSFDVETRHFMVSDGRKRFNLLFKHHCVKEMSVVAYYTMNYLLTFALNTYTSWCKIHHELCPGCMWPTCSIYLWTCFKVKCPVDKKLSKGLAEQNNAVSLFCTWEISTWFHKVPLLTDRSWRFFINLKWLSLKVCAQFLTFIQVFLIVFRRFFSAQFCSDSLDSSFSIGDFSDVRFFLLLKKLLLRYS